MYKRETNGLIKHFDFVVLDIICLQIGFILAYFLICGFGTNPYEKIIYRNIAILIELISIIVMIFNNTFKNVLKRECYAELLITCKHTFLVLAASILFLYFLREAQQYSRLIVISTFSIYIILTYVARVILKRYLKRRLPTIGSRRLLVVTTKSIVEKVLDNFKVYNLEGFQIAGLVILDEDLKGSELAGKTVVANADDAADYVCKGWVDEVFVILSPNVGMPEQLLDDLMNTGVTVHINLSKLGNLPGGKQLVEKIANYTVMTASMNQISTVQLAGKRIMDIIGGFVGCLLTGLIFLFIAPIIYINSPGPIFFAQERIGKNGKAFKIYKFRSMYLDAEERKAELMSQNKIADDKMFKMDFDPRVIGNKILPDGTKKTGIGQFIRDTSLDEFPQFWNVLTGSMSLVGTRPPLISEVHAYDLHHRSRLAIKPGITGMWQVSGRSDITDFEEVVALDQQYISNWTFGLDIKILFRTIYVVFKKEGSK